MTKPVRIYEAGLRNVSRAVVCVFLIAFETPSFAGETIEQRLRLSVVKV
jgi:hypothetical protein